ncbi:hypothetical protein LMG31506_02966 [Cupriavidus yeoncheonensis]|uniref:Uncharacterized protein n=1 Tax=Cupriavidus yeoncheonensis TaxID=1462994 RepID=A0A916MVL5_9BURK|nr:hypothetical protein [Cupriavidus yeoncheonensis]CAG2144255.1 hypothetical protein LMG31506_02966 [Cupriavidus yeoncheonensis]
MTIESYQGYTVRGFARQFADGSFEASGAVEIDGRVLDGADPLGYYPSFALAAAAGIAWAKAWVDDHG